VTTTCRSVSRTLGVVVVIVAVVMTALVAPASAFLAVAFVAATIFTVAAVARMESDNFLGGSRLGHNRRRGATQVGNSRCRLSRFGHLND
jgi:hypothetical protein